MNLIFFYLSVLLIFCVSILQGNENTKKSRRDGKHLEINAIITEEMEAKFNLQCCGFEAGGVDGLKIIGLSFYTTGVLSVDESRQQMIELITYYMNRLNSFKELEPYAANFPFELKNISLTLFYRNEEGDFVYDPSVGVCYNTKDSIVYCFNDKENSMRYKNRIKENYEEAVEKVKKTKLKY